jgi:hypothetical protein
MAGSAYASGAHSRSAKSSAAESVVRTGKTFQTAAALRDLWVGHIFWVRGVSLSVINKLDDMANVAEQQAV